MRVPRTLILLAATTLACKEGLNPNDTVELTLRLKLQQGYAVGPTPGRVFIFTDSAPGPSSGDVPPMPRARAFPELAADVCVLETTPITTCTVTVPRFGPVTLIATESVGAVFVRLDPQSPQDTVRDGRYVEFTGWTECPDRAERGLCVVRPKTDAEVEGVFQLMQQVTVYQTGAARMEYRLYTAAPTLRVPAENYNLLDYAGCKRSATDNPWVVHDFPCDSVRVAGDSPYHRFTAYVPRQTIVAMFPIAGPETEYDSWVGDPCIISGIYWPGVCSLITPDTVVKPLALTARFTWWECPGGPSDRDLGGCVLRRP
jgi:hypothetical protein